MISPFPNQQSIFTRSFPFRPDILPSPDQINPFVSGRL
jgi:hypothetical protein